MISLGKNYDDFERYCDAIVATHDKPLSTKQLAYTVLAFLYLETGRRLDPFLMDGELHHEMRRAVNSAIRANNGNL